MMRALYTSATGMMAQQLNMDVIANNLANVNTTGFKRSRADFQDLLYQEMRPAGTVVAQGAQAPTGVEVGLGVKTGATETMFDQGTFQNTGNKLDVAIEGDGFYKVLLPDGSTGYTRDGAFKRDSQGKLVNSDGMAIQPEITIPSTATDIAIGKDGTVSVTEAGNSTPQTIGKITLTQFSNPAGLKHLGGNNFAATDASGSPVDGTAGQGGFGTLSQGILEMSNVQIVQEMVNMITAQRAYETNSKSIQTADEMLQTANQLKH
ncbi:flagellar basal-body rod protein FlgG [Capsulimonas corticalis]|uniref:Flagellar basal-body rod protein FlgG n=1 Tax=Capsulimonas corticalis TaxID=2219043 RepID=A0A402CSA9_9BACT|nr:flagellar basal-body rod protein FlgG [Capsulimonas corticalis]BDI28305.1 flagellar basal-body rod protein FlgG [Capsulimonas corticalis]